MKHTKRFLMLGFLLGLLWIAIAPVSAGNTIISINSGEGSSTFTIKDEPALVINGFDLSALALPVTIDALTLNVVQPVLGQTVSVLVYEDPNGGTPQDAKLLSRTDVNIVNTGNVRIPLAQAITTSSKIIWAGVYLPVDFKFVSDTSGTSVLTYWAWTPFSTFDLANLNTAAVFGPGDGSAPVSINMNGKARITLELTQADGRTTGGISTGGAALGQQIVGDPNTSLSPMQSYGTCGNILFDPADITVAGESRFTLHCKEETAPMQPGIVGNISAVPSSIPGFERRGVTYQIFANGDFNTVPSQASRLRTPVTHCIAPNAGDLEKAVMGVAYGQPQAWYILTTQRYGNYVCAELTDIGPVSYFVPRTGQETYLNSDLLFSGSVTFSPALNDIVCNKTITFNWAVKNDGFEATPVSIMRLANIAIRTGQVTLLFDVTLPSIPPGQTVNFSNSFVAPNSFLDEFNRLVLAIDPNSAFNEINESNNAYVVDYILKSDVVKGCAR
jgi:hypothetical protein